MHTVETCKLNTVGLQVGIQLETLTSPKKLRLEKCVKYKSVYVKSPPASPSKPTMHFNCVLKFNPKAQYLVHLNIEYSILSRHTAVPPLQRGSSNWPSFIPFVIRAQQPSGSISHSKPLPGAGIS